MSISDALNKVSDNFGFKIAFNVTKTDKSIINKEVNGNTQEEFIANLLTGTPFDFVFKHGSFLIVDRPTDNKSKALKYDVFGSVSDMETGEKLSFASIYLPNLRNNIGTAATDGGTFSIRNIDTNPVHLVVSLIGYFPVDTMLQYSGFNISCDLRLKRKVNLMDSVIVKQNKLEMVDLRSDADFATTINPSKLIDLPALAETDVFRALQLLPGIKYSENTSELSIRGGSSDQNLVLFDGQTLYNLSHYYGVVSILNPNVIKDIQVYKGGYDSRYGERVSGIVDITGKSGNTVRPTVYGDLNLISGNLTTEIPISKRITLVAAARRSYSDIYSTGLAKDLFKTNTYGDNENKTDHIYIESTPSFRFFDYNTKLTYQISNKEHISLSYYGGKDYFSNDYSGNLKNISANTSDKNNWSNYGVSVAWLKQWNGTFYTNLQVGNSGYNNTSKNTDIVEVHPGTPGMNPLADSVNRFKGNNRNDLTDFSVNLKNNINFGKHQLGFGFGVRGNTIYFRKDAGSSFVYDTIDQKSWSYSSYVQERISAGNKLILKPGVRLSLFTRTGKLYFEPRFAANYKALPGLSFRVATGRYYQFLNQVLSQQETGYNKNFWVMADDSLHPVVKSDHYIIGTTFENGNFLFDAEAYYKTYTGIQEYVFKPRYVEDEHKTQTSRQKSVQTLPESQSSYFLSGNGRMYGLDFMLRYKQRSYTGWVSYSISRSLHQFDEINSGNDIPAPTDQIHQLSFTNMVTYGKWNFGSTLLFNTGKPYIDSADIGQSVTRYYKRLPNYFRMDISANYNFRIRNLQMKVGASVLNVFNNKNYYEVNNRKFSFDNLSYTETNLIRSQDLSFNLFLHFQL